MRRNRLRGASLFPEQRYFYAIVNEYRNLQSHSESRVQHWKLRQRAIRKAIFGAFSAAEFAGIWIEK
jgi:hypothetical protein